MITLNNLTEDNYFLPEDGTVSRTEFLRILSLPTEGYLNGFGFNMKDAFQAIKDIDVKGVPTDLLLDYMQSQGPSAKPMLKDLRATTQHTSIVLTTAGVGSKSTSQIWHGKGFTKKALDGGEPWCWEGSVNFSDSGWLQGNTARVFRSQAWADEFIKQHMLHKEWAIANHAQYQATILETGQDPFDVYFDSVADNVNQRAVEIVIAMRDDCANKNAKIPSEQETVLMSQMIQQELNTYDKVIARLSGNAE